MVGGDCTSVRNGRLNLEAETFEATTVSTDISVAAYPGCRFQEADASVACDVTLSGLSAIT